MKFTNARLIENIVYDLRLADYPRSVNRTRINSLANGSAPYTDEEEEANHIEVNVNDLAMTRLCHDARLQLYQGFNKPGNYYTCRTEDGVSNKKQERGIIVTNEISRIMKRSDPYFECQRSQLALNIIHGIGPAVYEDEDHWCLEPIGIEDVLMPSNTRLTFKNLPFFAVWRGRTPEELHRLTRLKNRDPGWNMPVVNQAIKWADEQTRTLRGGATWSEYWSPEKMEERFRQDSGVYSSDIVQTIDTYDFYYWDDSGKQEGWRRKIIFDAYGGYSAWNGATGYGATKTMPTKNLLDSDKGMFLYDSGDRVWGSTINEIIHFQFADLSAVAPFKYHSVRSLGWFLYSICHLQNRLNCKTWEAIFETLMPYFRVDSEDEAQRALKLQMVSRGVIDQTIHFLGQNERWNPNQQLVELGMILGSRILNENSSSYVQNQNFSRDKVEKTRFQVMAELNAMMTLVSAALQQAYRYQNSQYREIKRRFFKANSRDAEVREFRARCLKRGLPEKLMVSEAWEVEPERVMGSGNKTMEMAIAQQLMEWRAAYTPEAQSKILRMATLSVTDDAALANDLVPEDERISNTRHDAMVAFGSLMAGAIVKWKAEHNRLELAETLLAELAMLVSRVLKMGGMTTLEQVIGFQNVLMNVSELIAEISKDPAHKEQAKKLAETSGKLANQIKAFTQRLAEKQQSGNRQMDPEAMAKIQSSQMQDQVKIESREEAHSQKTAQRQVSFEMKEEQQRKKHESDLQQQAEKARLEIATKTAESELDIRADAARKALELNAKANQHQTEKPTQSNT